MALLTAACLTLLYVCAGVLMLLPLGSLKVSCAWGSSLEHLAWRVRSGQAQAMPFYSIIKCTGFSACVLLPLPFISPGIGTERGGIYKMDVGTEGGMRFCSIMQ